MALGQGCLTLQTRGPGAILLPRNQQDSETEVECCAWLLAAASTPRASAGFAECLLPMRMRAIDNAVVGFARGLPHGLGDPWPRVYALLHAVRSARFLLSGAFWCDTRAFAWRDSDESRPRPPRFRGRPMACPGVPDGARRGPRNGQPGRELGIAGFRGTLTTDARWNDRAVPGDEETTGDCRMRHECRGNVQ